MNDRAMPPPMTAEEFRSEVTRRGWTYRELAKRWGVSESYVSQLARKSERGQHWDDAVRGLPTVIIKRK